jgi:hypothetical protein
MGQPLAPMNFNVLQRGRLAAMRILSMPTGRRGFVTRIPKSKPARRARQ